MDGSNVGIIDEGDCDGDSLVGVLVVGADVEGVADGSKEGPEVVGVIDEGMIVGFKVG